MVFPREGEGAWHWSELDALKLHNRSDQKEGPCIFCGLETRGRDIYGRFSHQGMIGGTGCEGARKAKYEAEIAALKARLAVVEKRRLQGCCIDCGRKYGDEHGFPDLVIPNDIWSKISPTGDEGGLLCPSCMCRRAHDAGLSGIEARFRSGPFKTEVK